MCRQTGRKIEDNFSATLLSIGIVDIQDFLPADHAHKASS